MLSHVCEGDSIMSFVALLFSLGVFCWFGLILIIMAWCCLVQFKLGLGSPGLLSFGRYRTCLLFISCHCRVSLSVVEHRGLTHVRGLDCTGQEESYGAVHAVF